MGAQVGILSGCQFASLDGLAYSNQGRNLKTWWNFEDFIEGHFAAYSIFGIWAGIQNGAGALVGGTFSSALRPGQVTIDTGTTAGGYAGLYVDRNSIAPFLFGSGAYTFETDIYIPALSAVAEEFIFRVGFGDTYSADCVDGAYFEYDRLTNVNWLACTASNSARTKTDTLLAVAAGAWTRLKVVVNNVGNLVYYYINGTLFLTIGTNIPTGAGRNVSAIAHIIKSAGLTARNVNIDWTWLHADLNASR